MAKNYLYTYICIYHYLAKNHERTSQSNHPEHQSHVAKKHHSCYYKRAIRDKKQGRNHAIFGADEAIYNHLKTMVEDGMEAYRVTSFYFLLIDKKSEKVIGECGYHTWSVPHRRAELFYSLRNETDKRQGYMSEALKVILNYGFNELGIHRVAALTAPSNEASIALLKHYGFVMEGIHREDYVVNGVNEDSVCYSLLKWEWERRLAD